MVDLFAAVRRMGALLRRRWVHLRGAFGVPVPVDPALERLARDFIGELKSVPIVVPSRDLVEAVLQRLRRTDTDHSQPDGGGQQ
jgi:hypothetical protein